MNNESDKLSLQEDIIAVCKWMDTWLMKLSIEKCKVIRLGRLNKGFEYSMSQLNETKVLNSSECERDLGVMIARDLKWGTQAKSAALKGNKMLGMLKGAFVSRDVDL